MSREQDLIIKIKAQSDQATKDVLKLTKQVDELKKANDKLGSSKGVDKLSAGYSKLNGVLGGLVAGFSALAVGVNAVEFAKLASNAEQSADAFDKVFTEMGLNAQEEFDKIREASFGLIPEQAIKQSAVTAVSLGVPISKLGELMEVARVKAREMGTDAQSAFSDLATGIGRGSPMILDNLGLTIKLGEANQAMADSLKKTVDQLTKEEKALALTNAVIEAGADSVERFKDAGLSSREEFQKLQATLEDLKVELGKGLLKVLVDLAKETNNWLESLDPKTVEQFSSSIAKLGSGLVGIMQTVGLLNDIAVPDWLFGDNAGLVGTVAEGWALLGDMVGKATDEFDAVFNSMDQATQQATQVDGLARAVNNFAGSQEELGGLEEMVKKVFNENQKLIDQWQKADTKLYQDAINKLHDKQSDLNDILEEIQKKKDVYKAVAESAKEASKATGDLTQKTSEYTEENKRAIGDFYKDRLGTAKKTLSELEKDELNLTKTIQKAHLDLYKELSKINEDRFNSNLSYADKIREAEQEALDVREAYADKQLQADEKLALAKEALQNNQLERYRTYIQQYESLSMETVSTTLQGDNLVKKSAEETGKAKIAIYKTIQGLEGEYFNQRTQNAQTAHDLTVAQAEAERANVQLTIEAYKTMIDLMKQMVEATTGKKVDIDTSALDQLIHKAEASQTYIDHLTNNRAVIGVDSTQIDQSTQKVQQLKTLTMNGITLNVDANTTPADFGINKLVTKTDGKEVTMEVNADWEQAEKEIEKALSSVERDPIEKEVEADTSTASKQIDSLQAKASTPTGALHTVDVNNTAPERAIASNKTPTSSIHTIYVREVPTRSGGGSIPQKLAVGGTFRGSGRVPGYDATDSDKVNAYLTGGEFVIKRKAVDQYGLAFLHAINNMKLPKIKGYATGGLVGGTNQSVAQANMTPINLNIGGQSFQTFAIKDIAEGLKQFIDLEGGL